MSCNDRSIGGETVEISNTRFATPDDETRFTPVTKNSRERIAACVKRARCWPRMRDSISAVLVASVGFAFEKATAWVTIYWQVSVAIAIYTVSQLAAPLDGP